MDFLCELAELGLSPSILMDNGNSTKAETLFKCSLYKKYIITYQWGEEGKEKFPDCCIMAEASFLSRKAAVQEQENFKEIQERGDKHAVG